MAVTTVRGPVDVKALGYTLSHEHLFCDLWAVVRSYNGILDDEGLAAREVAAYRDAGGRTIIDVTSGGRGRLLSRTRLISASWRWSRSRFCGKKACRRNASRSAILETGSTQSRCWRSPARECISASTTSVMRGMVTRTMECAPGT